MPLTPEQVRALKEQLLSQIQHLPEEQKAEAASQISSLSPEALELMLAQQRSESGKSGESVFRLIIKGEILSSKIDENESSIAVLEINPVSMGHTIIIPKKPAKAAKEIPSEAFALAKKISDRITSKLEAKSAEIQTETKFGEAIINVIPVYDKPLNLDSPRKRASKEDLEDLESKLKIKTKQKIEKIKIETKAKSERKQDQVLKLPRKIP